MPQRYPSVPAIQSKPNYTPPPTKKKPKPCIECEDWMYRRLWIGYIFCPYCGRKLDRPKSRGSYE